MNSRINSYLSKLLLTNLIIGIIFFTSGTFLGTHYGHRNLLSVERETSTTQVCFTPAQHCLPSVLELIGMATEEILIQAYSFTSKEIADKIIEA